MMPTKNRNPARQVTLIATAELKAAEDNARTHPVEQVKQVAGLIARYGWTNPILVNEKNVIIAGHGRLAAAEYLGHEEVPVIVVDGLSQEEEAALRIADNQVPANAGWDYEKLASVLDSLSGDIDPNLLGFSDAERKMIMRRGMASGAAGLDDAAPEPPQTPIVRLGDVWVLGEHRLMCGDATKEDDVAKLFGDDRPGLMVTDPPYGVNYDPDWRNRAERSTGDKVGARSIGVVHNDDRCDWREAWALFPGSVAYVWHGALHSAEVLDSLNINQFEQRAYIVWRKQHFAIGRGNYHWQHEGCWYAVKKGANANWQGSRDQTTVWDIANLGAFGGEGGEGRTGHSTQKPVETFRRPILNNSGVGDLVYDPFVGSGTSIIACEDLKRRCRAMELDPGYCEIAVRRWQAVTSNVAHLEGDTTATLESLAKRRKVKRKART